MAKADKWARLLAYVTGLVNQELLLQNEYLAAENRILRSHLPSRLRLSHPERETLAEIGKRCCPDREAGYHSALVSKTDCGKVRRFPAPVISWSSPHQSGSGSADRQVSVRPSPIEESGEGC